MTIRKLMARLRPVCIMGCFACAGGGPFPAVDFAASAASFANHPSGAVILESDATIELENRTPRQACPLVRPDRRVGPFRNDYQGAKKFLVVVACALLTLVIDASIFVLGWAALR